jgi:amphi-Trp domain-containing protein
MEKKKVKIDGEMSRDVLAECLRTMAFDLDGGRLEIRSGEQTIVLTAPAFLPMEIVAKQKANKEKITIEMTWREAATPPAAETVAAPCPEGVEMALPAAASVAFGSGADFTCQEPAAALAEQPVTMAGSEAWAGDALESGAPEPTAADTREPLCGTEFIPPAGEGEFSAEPAPLASEPYCSTAETPLTADAAETAEGAAGDAATDDMESKTRTTGRRRRER